MNSNYYPSHTTLVVVLTDGTHRVTQYGNSRPDNYYGGLPRAMYEATRDVAPSCATVFYGTECKTYTAAQIAELLHTNSLGIKEAK